MRGGGRASHFTAAVTAALERTRRNAPAELVHDVGRNATVLVVVDAAVTAVVVPVDRRLTRLEVKGVLGGGAESRDPQNVNACVPSCTRRGLHVIYVKLHYAIVLIHIHIHMHIHIHIHKS